MLISAYNNNGLQDTLILLMEPNTPVEPTVTIRGNLTQIKETETGKVIGYNLFEASSVIEDLENGPVILTENQIGKLNQLIIEAGFEDSLTADSSPKFVVGLVQSCEPIKDSDHLNVTKTEVANNEVLQIVCGASNIEAGQKVVVAKEGALMPDGTIIVPGELRGVKSQGMICSAKELGLKTNEQKKGILVLSDETPTGAAFEPSMM